MITLERKEFLKNAGTRRYSVAELRNLSHFDRQIKPEGVIGQSDDFVYGYENGRYYVATSGFGYLLTGRLHLDSVDFVKALFEALNFCEVSQIDVDIDKTFSLVKSARKEFKSISFGDTSLYKSLFWYFVNSIES